MVTMNELDKFVWTVLRMRELQKIHEQAGGPTAAEYHELLKLEGDVDVYCARYVLPDPPISYEPEVVR